MAQRLVKLKEVKEVDPRQHTLVLAEPETADPDADVLYACSYCSMILCQFKGVEPAIDNLVFRCQRCETDSALPKQRAQ